MTDEDADVYDDLIEEIERALPKIDIVALEDLVPAVRRLVEAEHSRRVRAEQGAGA